MARRGENIRKRTDGRWEKRYIESYHPDGTAKYKSVYGRSYAEVKSKYSLLQNGSMKKEPTTILTVDRLCILWLEDVQITVKQSTYANYYSIVHNHIMPYFQGMKTRGLTNEAVSGFIREKTWNGRLDGGGGLSPKTVSDIALVLKAIIQYGTDNNHLSGVSTKLKLPKVPNKLLKVLSVQEQNRLVQALLMVMAMK